MEYEVSVRTNYSERIITRRSGGRLPARELDGHPEAAQLDGGGVLPAGQEHAVRLHVAVDYVILVAVAQRLQYLAHIVAEKIQEYN